MNRRNALALSIALLVGFATPVVLAIVYAQLASHIDPAARFALFLSTPRHPVRLAVLAWSLQLGAGVTLAFVAVHVSRRHATSAWKLAFAFTSGYAIFIALTAPLGGPGRVPWPVVGKVAAPPLVLVASVALLEVRRNSRRRLLGAAA